MIDTTKSKKRNRRKKNKKPNKKDVKTRPDHSSGDDFDNSHESDGMCKVYVFFIILCLVSALYVDKIL